MKIKLGVLFNAVGSHNNPGPLTKLSRAELPLKLSFRISKFLKRVQEELTVFEEKRLALVEKYAKRNAKGEVGKNMKVADENLEAFHAEFKELSEIEADIDFEPVKLSVLDDVKFPPNEIGMIDWFLENDL